jgi:hypothetical protein
MNTAHSPYFIWDYDLTESDVQDILQGKDEEQKFWLVARLLESARFEDVWKYISLDELREIFPFLQLKPQVRAAWEFALHVWATDAADPS